MMPQDIRDYHRYCPDQPGVLISDAVCLSRRHANYHLCSGCPFNDDEKTGRPWWRENPDKPPPPRKET
jgi:hypothetical protein